MRRRVGRAVVVAFVLFHATAVVVYSIPRPAGDRVSAWIRGRVLPLVAPYMFVTSQWQLWNMFAPDPPRLVTAYRTDVGSATGWRELVTIQPGSFPVWRHNARFQLMRNLLRDGVAGRESAVERYLHLHCEEHGLAPATPVRLTYIHYLIPVRERRDSRAGLDGWRPDLVEHPTLVTACPERT
jgi:hypothetical protein